MAQRNNITFLLPSKDRVKLLKQTVENIRHCCEEDGVTYEIIVIYCPQDKATRKYAKSQKDITPFSQENGSMVKAVNSAYSQYSTARYITFWSDDLKMYPGLLRDSVDYLEAGGEDVPCVGAIFPFKTLNCPFPNQSIVRFISVKREIKHYEKDEKGEKQIVSRVNPYYKEGGSFPVLYYGLLKTEIFAHIGMLDERFTGYGNDDDMVLKLYSKGFHNHIMYEHYIDHFDVFDKTKQDNMENTQPLGVKLIGQKWGGVVYTDCIIT